MLRRIKLPTLSICICMSFPDILKFTFVKRRFCIYFHQFYIRSYLTLIYFLNLIPCIASCHDFMFGSVQFLICYLSTVLYGFMCLKILLCLKQKLGNSIHVIWILGRVTPFLTWKACNLGFWNSISDDVWVILVSILVVTKLFICKVLVPYSFMTDILVWMVFYSIILIDLTCYI